MGLSLSWLLATLAAIARRRWVRIVCLAIPLALLATQISLILLFNQCINTATVLMLFETTWREAKEFCSISLANWEFAAVCLLSLALLFAAERLRLPLLEAFHRIHLPSWPRIAAAALLTPILLSGAKTQWDHTRLAWADSTTFQLHGAQFSISSIGRSVIPANSLFFSISYLRTYIKAYATNADLSRRILQGGRGALNSTGCDSLNIIVVIGETHIKHRSQLYGYALPNEPWLTEQAAQGQLVAYNNAVTCASYTTETIVNALCLNDVGKGEGIENCAFWPALFKAAGYYTSVNDYQVDLPEATDYRFDLSEFLYPHSLRDSLYDHLEANSIERDPDTFTVDDRRQNSNSLSIYHLMGQHFAYAERYPEEYSRFSMSDIAPGNRPWITDEERCREAQYANATLYNDHVLSQIAATVEGLDAILLYFGDHGEENFDYRNFAGRVLPAEGLEREWLQCVAEVPLIAWWTPRFAERHPEKVAQLRDATERPIYMPLIGHAILDLAGIAGWGYNTRCDFLSSEYQPPHRIVNRRYDYDALMKP